MNSVHRWIGVYKREDVLVTPPAQKSLETGIFKPTQLGGPGAEVSDPSSHPSILPTPGLTFQPLHILSVTLNYVHLFSPVLTAPRSFFLQFFMVTRLLMYFLHSTQVAPQTLATLPIGQ